MNFETIKYAIDRLNSQKGTSLPLLIYNNGYKRIVQFGAETDELKVIGDSLVLENFIVPIEDLKEIRIVSKR